MKLGAGEDLYALFAGILTMRPWNRVIDPAVDHLVIQGSDSDKSELQVSNPLQEYMWFHYYSKLENCTKNPCALIYYLYFTIASLADVRF